MPRRRRSKKTQQKIVPPIAPDPEHDPEFRALPPDRRTWIIAWWDHMIEMDRVRFKEVAALAISERYTEAGVGKKRSGHGFSRTSLLRRYQAWVATNRDWRPLDRYRSLRKPATPAPSLFNITPEAARAYFHRRGLAAATWAAERKFSPSAVSEALNGTRSGPRSVAILAALAADMRDEPIAFHSELQRLRTEWEGFGAKLSALEKRLASNQTLPP